MVEIAVLAGLVALWIYPRWSVLNKLGLIIFSLMAPGAAIVFFLIPDQLRTLVLWWTAYLAIFLGLGSMIVVWRIRSDAKFAQHSTEPVGAWAPFFEKGAWTAAKFFVPIWILVDLAVIAIPLMRGESINLPIYLLALFAPLFPFAYAWIVVKVTDFVTRPARRE